MNAGEKERTVDEVCHIIQRHAIELSPRICNPVSAFAQESSVPHPATAMWKKPQASWVKMNFDAAFSEQRKDGAWGFVARDDSGEFIAAAAGKLRHLRDALQAETEACVAAIEGAVALGLNRDIFLV